MRRLPVYVNEAFRPQRVSGQQRYAREIADRLPADWIRLQPSGIWARGRIGTWLWLQLVLPWRARKGVLISMTARTPLWHPRHVVVIHDMFVVDHPEWFSRSYYWTHWPLQLIQMRTAKALVCVSEPVATTVRERSHCTVRVAPNAPSDVFASAAADGAVSPVAVDGRSVIDRLELTAGQYLVTVGSLEPRKNLARLAQAYAQLPEPVRAAWPLVIVGGSADIYGQVDIDWPEQVVLAGYVDDDELTALYKHSGAVAFVSLDEGFGLPIVEAHAAGAPAIVCSDIDVFAWICGDHATYVDPLDPASIAAGLLAVTEGRSVPLSVESGRFTWTLSAATVAATAREVAELPGAAAGALTATQPPGQGLRPAVVIASAGRPEVLADLMDDLQRQTVAFDLVLCVPDDQSLPATPLPHGTRITYALGAAAQRNAAIELVPDADVLFTFDDDAVPREDYIERALELFAREPGVVALTGRVLLDGATGDSDGAISRADSEAAIAASIDEPLRGEWARSRELYGCNMAFRAGLPGAEMFDGRLPLYSWLEDHDLARRLMRHGTLVKAQDCVVVHRGVSSGGRTNHVRLGYSQAMNPLYLHHKGSFPLWLTVHEIYRRVLKNAVYAVTGPDKDARRDRLRGNVMGFVDAARGRFTPERIRDL